MLNVRDCSTRCVTGTCVVTGLPLTCSLLVSCNQTRIYGTSGGSHCRRPLITLHADLSFHRVAKHGSLCSHLPAPPRRRFPGKAQWASATSVVTLTILDGSPLVVDSDPDVSDGSESESESSDDAESDAPDADEAGAAAPLPREPDDSAESRIEGDFE
jgi:hypothetical protein